MAAILTLSACGGAEGGVSGITTGDGAVLDNAAEFLTEATAAWEEARPAQNVEVSEHAACFFVLGEDDAVTGDVACGGLRTTTAAEGEVWDLGEFQVRETSDNEMQARLPDDWASSLERSTTRPTGPVVDADGEPAPEEIDAVAAPPMPQTPSGFVLSGDVLPDDLVQPGDEQVAPGDAGAVETPGGRVEITSVALLETLPIAEDEEDGAGDLGAAAEDGDTDDGDVSVSMSGEPHAAADGEIFLAFDYDYTPDERPGESDTSSVALALNSGGEQRTLAELGTDTGWGGPSASSGRFLVSAAEEDPHLVVSSAGVDQVVALPEGQRESHEVTQAYYRDVTQQEPNHEFSLDDRPFVLDDDDYEASLYLNLQSAHLTAYSEAGGADGWAEPDMAWLLLGFDTVLDSDGFRPMFLELTPGIVVDDAEGDTYSTSRTIEIGRSTWNDSYWMAVEVPADITELSFTQSFEARAEARDDVASLSFEAASYDLSFPQDESEEDSDGEADEDRESDEEADEEADDADDDADDDAEDAEDAED